mgnify:CR=1 FL=1
MPQTQRGRGTPPRPQRRNPRSKYESMVLKLQVRWQDGESLSGSELAVLAQAGDDDAFDELFARQHDDLQRSIEVAP